MSNSLNSNLENPILTNKYSILVASQDPIAKEIVSNATDIYNNIVTFNTSIDIPTLDNSAVNIQNAFNKLINLASPCASVSNRGSNCSSIAVCKFVSYIEDLYLDLFLLISSPSVLTGEKSEYKFLPFFMTLYISNMVTSNPNNQNKFELPKIRYRLCKSQFYEPVNSSASMSAEYKKILARLSKKQLEITERQTSTSSINILLYILLPTVVFIVLILLYVQYVRKAKANEDILNEVISSIKKK
jgi:hypothetical protein